jgi:hypothetical protein
MKKAVLVLIVCVVLIGLYRGWFTFSEHHEEGRKVDVSLTVDPDKAKEDAGKMKERATEVGERARDKVRSATP